MSNYDGKGKQENGQRGVCPSLFLPAIFELLCYHVDHSTKRLRKCVFSSRIKYFENIYGVTLEGHSRRKHNRELYKERLINNK